MSVEEAQQLVQRAIDDPDFRARLENASQEEKRSVLESEGYGNVTLSHVSQALPGSAGGELSDEEFAAVAGAGGNTTVSMAAGGSVGGTVTFVATVVVAASLA
jgi:Nif11 domain